MGIDNNLGTKLSGLGHYCLCSVLSFDLLYRAMELISRSPDFGRWKNLEVDVWHPFGLDGAFRYVHEGPEKEAVLGWDPRDPENAMLSHHLLAKCLSVIKAGESTGEDNADEKGMSLEVYPGKTSDGWFVQANLSDAVWDVIEGPVFVKIVDKINGDICRWWEDQNGRSESGRYVILFDGKDGPTLQINQPGSGGTWIVGSRLSNNTSGYQFSDHNTDWYLQALSHIVSLCFVLDHCKKALLDK